VDARATAAEDLRASDWVVALASAAAKQTASLGCVGDPTVSTWACLVGDTTLLFNAVELLDTAPDNAIGLLAPRCIADGLLAAGFGAVGLLALELDTTRGLGASGLLAPGLSATGLGIGLLAPGLSTNGIGTIGLLVPALGATGLNTVRLLAPGLATGLLAMGLLAPRLEAFGLDAGLLCAAPNPIRPGDAELNLNGAGVAPCARKSCMASDVSCTVSPVLGLVCTKWPCIRLPEGVSRHCRSMSSIAIQ